MVVWLSGAQAHGPFDHRTDVYTWYFGSSIPNNWKEAISRAPVQWDNVSGQCHDFLQHPSGAAIMIRNVIDGPGSTIAFVGSGHDGVVFDSEETWQPDPNLLPDMYEQDLWNAATHEFGHLLYLTHSNSGYPNATMFQAIPKGETKKRSLESYDRVHEQNLYPPGSC